MLQIIIEWLNTIKRYSDRIFIKFERDGGSFEISLCVCSIRVFAKFSGDPYYEPLAWFMISQAFDCSDKHVQITLLLGNEQ